MLVNIVLARNVSASEFGAYGFFISLASVLAIPAVGGFPLLLMREVASYKKDNAGARYCGLMNTALLWTVIYLLFLVVGAIGYVLLFDGSTGTTLLLAILFVPLMSIAAINGGALRGFGQPALAAIPVQVLQPMFLIIGFILLASAGCLDATVALGLYGSVLIVVQLILIVAVRHAIPRSFVAVAPDYSDRQIWIRSFFPFATIGAMNILNTQVATLILGMLGDSEAVAYLRVAERGAQLVVVPLSIVLTIIGPQIVRHVKDDDMLELCRLARRSARLICLGAAPIALILVVFGRDLISITFGPAYSGPAYAPMIILVISQLFSALTGIAGMFLAMAGHEKHILIAQAIGLSTLFVLAAVLIPEYGVLGASLSAGLGIIATKAYTVTLVWRRFSVWTGLA